MAEFRGKIYENLVETIGATPLVRLNRFMEDQGVEAEILAKLEFFNPLASVKDRIGNAMIEAMEMVNNNQYFFSSEVSRNLLKDLLNKIKP